jgi:hypothetical protein
MITFCTETIRLKKQAIDNENYVKFKLSIANEIQKYCKAGRIDLQCFQEMMKGNIINPAHLEYYLTDEEIYTMTLKKYFKFASGVGDTLISADEFKYWLVNQMKI